MASANPKQTAAKRSRQSEAVRLRGQGLTYEQIGDELGVSKATVKRDLRDGLDLAIEATREEALEVRDAHALELRKVREAAWQMVDAAIGATDQNDVPIDFKAASALGQVIGALSREARLYGLDAPVKVETQAFVSMSDEEALRIEAEAKKAGKW